MGSIRLAALLATGCVVAAPGHAQAPAAASIKTKPVEATLVAPVVPAPDPLLDAMAPLPDGGVAWPTPLAATAGEGAAGIEVGDVRYDVVVTGLAENGLLARFRELSALWKGRGEPANLAQINRRSIEDSDLVDQLLRAQGNYGGKVEVSVTPPKGTTRTNVALVVDPGPVYKFAAIDLTLPAGAPADEVDAALGLKVGETVDATKVGTAEDGLKLRLADAGFPFPTVGPQDIVIDHATRTATLTQTIDPGRPATFGRVRFADTVRKPPFDNAHLAVLARLKPGDKYNAADLEDLRRALIQTGLFGSVSVRPVVQDDSATGSTAVDLVVSTEAAPLRTIAAQLGYSTGQGIRLETSWQHRNLLPPEGGVTFRGVASEREQLLGGELRRRNWRKRDVTLLLTSQLSAERQDAYKARSLTLGAAIERETNIIWQKKWTYSLGSELIASSQKDRSAAASDYNTYLIAALPLSLSYDGSDSLLDPARGFRLTGRLSPELSYQSKVFTYVKAQIEGSVYQPVGDRLVFAARAHFGSILGASRGTIAPTRRFYAGGGGSVRGFGYQQVGPMDGDGNPLGGNSITEASFEARYRFTAFGNDVGIVPFIDVGQVYTTTIPKFNSLKAGAGLGLRYYTSFGPVRIDVATPINRGPRDALVAFYVSIGQAF